MGPCAPRRTSTRRRIAARSTGTSSRRCSASTKPAGNTSPLATRPGERQPPAPSPTAPATRRTKLRHRHRHRVEPLTCLLTAQPRLSLSRPIRARRSRSGLDMSGRGNARPQFGVHRSTKHSPQEGNTMIRLLTILAAVVALAVSAGPAAASTGEEHVPRTYHPRRYRRACRLGSARRFGVRSRRPGTDRSISYLKAGPSKQPPPRGNGIIAVLIGAVGVTDGTSNTVMFAERSRGILENTMVSGHSVKARPGAVGFLDIGTTRLSISSPPRQAAGPRHSVGWRGRDGPPPPRAQPLEAHAAVGRRAEREVFGRLPSVHEAALSS